MDGLSALANQDMDGVLHGMTQLKSLRQQGPVMIDHGQGIYIWDEAGKQYIDGLAGLWCTTLGYGNEEVARAAYDQMVKLSYGHIFLDKGHETAARLAETLKELVPGGFSKVFFGLSGSDANDTQVKLARYYFNAIGKPEKKKIISRQKGYHGVTMAAASATGLPPMHKGFDLPNDGFIKADCPHYYRFRQDGETEEDFTDRLAHNLENLILREGPETVAGFIAEPIMGAGGVIVPPESYFPKIQPILRKYNVLFIDDEVVTGFGRTGSPFGADSFGLEPDTMTLAKSLTSAYLPLSAVMLPAFMYEAMLNVSDDWGVFGHGYTYSGHPVSCAVALKVLEIYRRDALFDHAAKMGEVFQRHLRALNQHPLVGEARGRGMIGACELVADKETGQAFDVNDGVGKYALSRMKENGLISRAIGDSLALCPPLAITEAEIAEIFERYQKSLDETLDWASTKGLLKH